MNKCLVLVDLQNDYFPDGKMELAGIEAVAENAQLLLTEFRKTKAPLSSIYSTFPSPLTLSSFYPALIEQK
jgi:nicotinamidase-related amidase